MPKSKLFFLKCTSAIMLVFSLKTTLFAQIIVEKDILMTEYPAYYDMLRNSIIESQITDDFIKSHHVKTITELTDYKSNHSDTILPIHCLHYDSSGQLSQREEFYYGMLTLTEYFTNSKNKIIVHNKRVENDDRYELSYEVELDSLGNPIKYINYDSDNNGKTGLDSIIYTYKYDAKGKLLTKRQQLFYNSGYAPLRIFKYNYNQHGQNLGYTVSSADTKLYSVSNEYSGNNLIQKKNATYEDGKEKIATDLNNKGHIGGMNYFDSTTYHYGPDLKLGFIKRTFLHDPLVTYTDDILIQLIYDEKGFLSEKFNVANKQKDDIIYKWEFYE
jgi:hypothetical protein